MRMPLFIKKNYIILIYLAFLTMPGISFAAHVPIEDVSIDRIQLVGQQIHLLKNRLEQAKSELSTIKQNDRELSQFSLDNASKNLLDKASLDITVSQSNLDGITIELSDSEQTASWLEKNIQEIENQLNVLNIFGLKAASSEKNNIKEYHADLNYQKKLLGLEKNRIKYLQELQGIVSETLVFNRDKYQQLNQTLKSRKMLHMKQRQVRDELLFQEQQNRWLAHLNVLYSQLSKIDPSQSKESYAATEREIFYTNENANHAYTQSLIARYKDQIQQIKLMILKSNSISLLNEINNQVQALSKQINRLEKSVGSRMLILSKHISYLSKRKDNVPVQTYTQQISALKANYVVSLKSLKGLDHGLSIIRKKLDLALQNELSSRQGFPTFSYKNLMDIGKELLLVPPLTFQIVRNVSNHLLEGVHSAPVLKWCLFVFSELIILTFYIYIRKTIKRISNRSLEWANEFNTRWLGLQYMRRNFTDLLLLGNLLACLFFFNVPLQNFLLISYLALVWLVIKAIMTVSRISLVETTHDTSGHDTRLYYRLKWIIGIGGIITALTVFMHQLPLIYELKSVFDRLFLLLLMLVSLLLLRSWDVVPNLIVSQMESQHPYLQKSIRLIGFLIPVLLFTNSIIGLIGFVNLVMTVSWYEGIFLIVLIGYLILRGLLSDGMVQLSRLMIQYVNNGWLWTEAFLKPIDRVLRITLFLTAGAVLFLLYGWDKQSPIVERLTRLLNYHLLNVLNTTVTPIMVIELFVVVSVFYWIAKWTREFVYRLLLSRTKDLGIRNSIAILSQYAAAVIGIFIALRVMGIDLRALTFVAGMFGFGIGLGLRDLANNFVSGFLLLFERPLRVGDIININGLEGEVLHIGSRAVTIRTWEHMELLVPNAEFFSKSFTNWTSRDSVVRSIIPIKISRYDNPHEVKVIIQNILAKHDEVLKDPLPDVYLKDMSDTLMEFEIRYYVNIRQIKSRTSVISQLLLNLWDEFTKHGIKPPYPQHQILLKSDLPSISFDATPPVNQN